MKRTQSILGTLLVLAAASCTGEVQSTSGDRQHARDSSKPPKLSLPPARFTTFESGQVRPLALSPSGQLLFAVNTPDDRLEIFGVRAGGLDHLSSIEVGLEPVAVAARSDDEVWVVNHLSDSVSIVSAGGGYAPRVVRTLLVGDEPRDIVFAGAAGHTRAFITTAHRGQNSPVDPQLTTAGMGRADVFVFDASNLGGTLGGTPLAVLTLFADTPRALTTSPDGRTVYAAAFLSGNQTTVVSKGAVNDLPGISPGMPLPNTITIPGLGTIPQPPTGLVVKKKNGHWLDAAGRPLDPFVTFDLPDQDVFAIDATANPPQKVRAWSGVGTTLFSMATNPVSGKIYVANIDARNHVRFEGAGNALVALGADPNDADKTVRGHIAESRITVIDGDQVLPRHLNKHIDYHAYSTPGEKAKSLAFPQGMAISRDGTRLYVAALGSAKVGVFSTVELEQNTFVPSAGAQIPLSAGGPTGVVLDEAQAQLFVLTRFDDGISVINTATQTETAHVHLYNPEPTKVVQGRPFLYNADYTSIHGDSACASCHIFGDFDGLAWDLGNPDGFPLPIPGPFTVSPDVVALFIPHAAELFAAFQPLKGPMTTQSLRGMDNHGAMHWRGDRNGGAPGVQPDTGAFSEQAAFNAFNVAFPGLVGRDSMLEPAEMQQFTDFILQVSYPPNPIRNLDNSLTPQQQVGRAFFFNHLGPQELPSDRFHSCTGCHVLDPSGNAGATDHPGFFGTDGKYSFENEDQIFKVPHLRNAYQKVGMFGMSPDPAIPTTVMAGGLPYMGDQVRGFGFFHDGDIDSVFRFLQLNVFIQNPLPLDPNPLDPTLLPIPPNPFGIPAGPDGDPLRRAVESFVMAFDSNLAPIVGQQVTLTATNGLTVAARILLLETRAVVGECDLVVRGFVAGRDHGWLYTGGLFQPDSARAAPISDLQLRVLAIAGTALTFTCTPPGSGVRLALDRDGDGYADSDELDWGSDPADPMSHP